MAAVQWIWFNVRFIVFKAGKPLVIERGVIPCELKIKRKLSYEVEPLFLSIRIYKTQKRQSVH
jgi:hypothetical protein